MSNQQPTDTNQLREMELPLNLKTNEQRLNECVSASDFFRFHQISVKDFHALINNSMFGKQTNKDFMKDHYHFMNNSTFGKHISK